MASLARITSLALAAPLLYSLFEPHRLLVRHFDVVLENLPPAAEGLKIAQISDLHFSAITSRSLMRRAVDMCNAQQPDVIALTGDYVSNRDSYAGVTLARQWGRRKIEYATEVTAELARLHAPNGVFAVPGNHDYSRERLGAIDALMRAAGITLLINHSVRLRGALPFIGLDDLRAGRPQIREACANVAPDEAQIILSHNPRLVWLLAQRNCLILSGHTHGGQVRLPLTTFRYRPIDMRGTELHHGWYREGWARLYISPGLGSVHFPMRFRCPPEIAVFTLRSA
jgi:predicted MPP superfamily phosphohydrolase